MIKLWSAYFYGKMGPKITKKCRNLENVIYISLMKTIRNSILYELLRNDNVFVFINIVDVTGTRVLLSKRLA